jgi:hypothetical protein
VVSLYLLPSVNLTLRPRLFALLKPGTRVVSHAFDMGDWEPDKRENQPKARNGLIFLWVIPAPVGGTWQWTTKTREGELNATLNMGQEFQAVRGTLTLQGGGKATINNASLTGKDLKFTVTVPMGGQEINITYSGKVEGDTIEGVQEWQNGPNAGKYPWSAKRQAPNIQGTWQFDLKPKGKEKPQQFLVRLESSPTGMKGIIRDGQNEVALANIYQWGSSFRFEMPQNGMPLIFRGSLEGNAGAGKVMKGDDFSSETTFTAQHPKEGAPSPKEGAPTPKGKKKAPKAT